MTTPDKMRRPACLLHRSLCISLPSPTSTTLQGLEIHWRDNRYCPTLDEYVEMVKGKTSTPFVMAAELFFLHATDLRLKAFACMQTVLGWTRTAVAALDQVGLPRHRSIAAQLTCCQQVLGTDLATPLQSPQQQVLELFDLTGVFFQVRLVTKACSVPACPSRP